ncbi:unnamed protein product [Clavelina lepadiformis]|uniref:Asparagine synthetase [glutamine-hydrolyzing] n=1 Tax=Clavelina lepadiformis TaxID=159417 RepID=A0ABP0FUN4_CLALP
MCGIWALFGCDSTDIKHYASAFAISHRGPDCYQLQNVSQLRNCTLAFHRLCVVDTVRGTQPMRLVQYPHLTLLCNGEIYNFRKIKEVFGFSFETACDCEIILHLYNKFGIEKTVSLLDGVFACVILDTNTNKVMLARDTYGVRPMFYFTTRNGMLGLCSEAKGLGDILKIKNGEEQSKLLHPFPPAHYMVYDVVEGGKVSLEKSEKFHIFANRPLHWQYQNIELQEGDLDAIHANIRKLFTNAVEKRLMASRRVGSLLSGGLDSSLVAAITAKKLKAHHCPQQLQTFSIGMGESPDLIAARKVADHIGSEHHEVNFTAEEGIQAVDDVIYATESFDITTIRASTPMYLLSKYISQQTDTIVIMSGEGADELAQGYIYFHKQPSAEDGDKESRRLLEDLHLFDVLRTDRSTAAHGLEVRAPFLDHAFTSYYLSLDSELRAPTKQVEKYLLRSAFDKTGLLPNDILWRKKEAFSDGVSTKEKSWFMILKTSLESKVSDEELAKAAETYPHCTPKTKEGLYYRKVFEQRFGTHVSHLIPYIWLPRWMECDNDPSARVLANYNNDEK